MIFSEELKSEVKVWHLVTFNLFFYVLGESIARFLGGGLLYKNIFNIFTTLIFIYILVLILPIPRKFTFITSKKIRSKAILSGILHGIFLWLLMTLFQPSVIDLLNNCEMELCNSLASNLKGYNSFIQYDKVSNILVFSMIIRFVIVGPIEEELLYRTSMFIKLEKKYCAGLSSFIVALIFSVFHLKFFLFFLIFSLVLSALIAKYRSLLPAILAHGTYNFLIYFISPPGKFFHIEIVLGAFSYVLTATIMGFSLFFSIKAINKFSLAK